MRRKWVPGRKNKATGGPDAGSRGCVLVVLASPVVQTGKESACIVGDPGTIPGSGRSPGEGNGNPLQYSGLANTMDRGAWWAIVHDVTKSWTQLSMHTHIPILSRSL